LSSAVGLPVALGIVRKHGGSITVASDLSQGSVFRVFLPVTEMAIPAKQVPMVPVQQTARQAAVLVVEDDAALLKVVTLSLKRQGFPIFAAMEGVEAVALFEKHREEIGCVLCDLTMPRLGGWETLNALRRLTPGITVIISRGFNETLAMKGCHSEMPQAYLSKPYEMKSLVTTIKQVMSL
jgi:two-component system, cell cycle sensor histidine kinase and response regulator CckA